jgi:putative ABC transport system permease protein
VRREAGVWDGDPPTLELPLVEPVHVYMRDLLSEVLAGIVRRPGRSALTMLGTVLGVGICVAVLGLTATARGQVGTQLTQLVPTTVTVDDVGATRAEALGGNPPLDLPADAESRIDALHGVVSAGVYWTAPVRNPVISALPAVSADSAANVRGLTVFAASPGTLAAMQPSVHAGTLYNAFHQQRAEHVAVLGADAARRLGIANLASQPAVFVGDTAFTVVGIIADARRLPETLQGILIPSSTAEALYGPPDPYTRQGGGAHMLIRTRAGAADQVAHEAALALDSDHPASLHAAAPPDPRRALRDSVNGDLSGLLLLLAGTCLLVGALGIANSTVVAVLERSGEIGLRRALGARRRHIAAQFLAESTALATLGGLLGTGLGVAVVVCAAPALHWTALLDPVTTVPAPLIGSALGFAAGLYPACRAAAMEPLEALGR